MSASMSETGHVRPGRDPADGDTVPDAPPVAEKRVSWAELFFDPITPERQVLT
jgi:low temperature requirement protein LtrA